MLTTTTVAILAVLIIVYSTDLEPKKVKPLPALLPPLINDDFNADFNVIEIKARDSFTLKEKEEVEKLIDIFTTQYSYYSGIKYNVQILQCINRMKSKNILSYKFEFLN